MSAAGSSANPPGVRIRRESPADAAAVRDVNIRAFGQQTEADLVDALRDSGVERLSLVAVDGGAVVGHILFTPVMIGEAPDPVRGMGLAPMAVAPERQRQGIGSALVREGVRMLAERACPFIVVLGHPEYYPRFGFEPAAPRDIRCAWPAPPDAFMILVLDDARMNGVRGLARYRGAFDAAV